MSKSKRRCSHLGRKPRFESLEDRIVLDTQLGTVAMPYDGYLSVGIYDSNNQIVRTLLAQAPEQAGTVSLTWDGKDQLGRLVSQNGTYTWKALTSQISPVDQGFVGDTEALPNNGAPNQGYNIQSLATSTISGAAGDVGGTFVRSGDSESYFGDTNLSQGFTLNSTITASGRFFFSDVTNMTGVASYIGHFSSSTADNRREFMGLEFQKLDLNESVFVRARLYPFDGSYFGGVWSGDVVLAAHTGYYNWSYTYDPNYDDPLQPAHAGPEGRLAIHIYNNGGVDTTLYAVNTGAMRDAGATFDAFGMGSSKLEPNFGNNATISGKIFMDDVSYSGNTGVQTFSSNPGWVGSGNTSNGNNFGWNSSSNADGALYTASYLEESLEPVAKIAADGSWQWGIGAQLSIGVAADETYTYYTQHINGQDRLYRVFNRDGGPAPFALGVNYLLVNPSAPDPTTDPTLLPGISVYHYNAQQWRTYFGSTWGIATDGFRIWVSDYRNNRVLLYDRATGASLGQFSITKPLGIAVDTATPSSSTVWIANNGDRVTKLTFNGSFTASTTITGLSDPSGVAIGGTSHHLFVAESGLTRIDEYDISGTPVLAGLQHFGSQSTGGALANNQFYWSPTFGSLGSIAIDPTGILSVLDGQRIQRFYTTSGGGHTAGDLYDSLASEFAPTPSQAYNFTAGGKHYLVSGRNVYEVDPEYTGGPRTGWMGDGSWRLVERYNFGTGEDTAGPGLRRTLMDGATPRDLFFSVIGHTVVVYSLESGGERQAAMVGTDWAGPDRTLVTPSNEIGLRLGGRFNWTDSDGDGVVDWNGVGSGTSDGEVSWNIPFGQYSHILFTYPWIDDAGNIWYADDAKNIIKVPFEGFANTTNGKRNPIYNWADQQIVIPFQDDQYDFRPYQVRIAGNGDIYAMGSTNASAGKYIGVNGTDWIAIYNSSGVRQCIAPTVDDIWASIAIDQTDSDPDYYFAGEAQWASMYTKDGLLVARFTNDGGSGTPTGWMDTPYSISAFTQPLTGQLYVYGEEVFYGKSSRWRIDNLSTIQRQQGTFSYTASTAPSGHWELDSNLNDPVGGNTGSFSGGSASYVAGQVGNAIDLDGVDDTVTLPYSSNITGGYTISAWVKPTDTTFVSIVSRGSANPLDYSHQIRLNASGKFEHFTYDGAGHIVTGTTTAVSNTWYYVAITATNNGLMHLYVNGAEEGTAQSVGALWTGGDRFKVSSSNGGGGFFDGLVDDLRVYESALNLTDIQAIYNKTIKPNVSIIASDATAAEQSLDPGKFLVLRDNTNGNLVVNYTISGTATSNSDYSTLVGSVTIPNGSSSVVVTVTPLDDATVDGNETVILTLASSANYNIGLGTLASATVKIVDNDTTTVSPNGYWPFENTLVGSGTGREFGLSDFAGSNNGVNHGTTFFEGPVNTPTYDGLATYATGQIGKAVSLDGKNDYLSIPYANDASAYTIAAWVKPSSVFWYSLNNITYESILARSDVDSITLSNVSEQIRINGTGKFEHYTNDGAGHTVTGTTTVQPDTWYHVAITASSNGLMRLYVNGVEEGTAQSIGNIWTGGDRFQIASIAAGMGLFKGLVDDLQIYDAQLTQGQIQAIYSQNASVTVSASDPNAGEPSDTGTFTISRTSTAGNLVVNYAVSGAATSGSDYSAIGSSVTIPNGSSTVTVTVIPIDDSTAENTETVILTLSSGTGYSVGAPNTATVNIADDEPTVTVTASDPSASELGTDKGVYTFARTNTSGNLVVNYTISGTATSGSDYTALTGSVTIASGSLTATVTLTPIDDSVAEGDEAAILTITSSSGYTIGTPNSASISIADNEATVIVTATDASAAEQGAGIGVYTFTRSNTTGNLAVVYAMSGTASSGSDYTALASTVTILSGSTTATVTITPIDDPTVEGDETAILTISSNASYFIGSPSIATVTITDNESTVTVAATDASASEPGTDKGVYTFTRTNTSGALVVNYTMTGTALNGTDYTSLPGSITIANSSSTATLTLTPKDDASAEGDETAILTLSTSTIYTLGTSSSATVTISDDEPTVTVAASDPSASEPGTDKGVYTFTRTNTTGNLVVNYTMSGTANSGSDYTALAGSVTIASGSSTATVTLTPIDDSAFEVSETAILTISTSASYFVGSPNNATVTIADNDTQAMTGRWRFDGNLNDSVGTYNGTFTGGTAAYGTGKIGQALNLDGVDDNVDLPYVTDPNAYTMSAWVKPVDVTSVVIMSRGSSNVNEGSNLVMIDGNSKFAFSIYATNGNFLITGTTTVQANTWYHVTVTATNNGQMHLFVNGVEEGTAQNIATMWDAGDRYHVGLGFPFISLGYYSGLIDDTRFYTQALSASDIQTIYNEPIVSVAASDASASEPNDPGAFTLTRNGTSGSLVVNYTVSGSATSGTDYSALAGSVTILAGSSSANISVIPIDDSSSEGDETILLTISSSSSYNIGATSSTTVTISDNEMSAQTGRWRFDNNVNDSVGTNNGIFNGGTAAYGTGLVGQAIDLDGMNDYVEIPYATDPNAYTMSAWIKPSDVTSVDIMARGSQNISEGSNIVSIDANSKFSFSIYATDATHLITGTTTVQTNTWYHVAVVASNNGLMHLYVNGVEEGTAQTIGTMWDAGDRYRVGVGYPFIGLGNFDGLVDDLRIYESALSAANIQSVYNEPIVTVTASDANAAEQGADPGVYTLTRTNTSGSLVVNYTMSGTATSGSDYTALAGSVTFSVGSSTVNVTVTPIDDSTADANETVILTISSSANYDIGTPSSATVTIADNEPTLTITASDPNAAEPSDTGTFTITRTTTSGSLVVYYAKSGTATNGTDYSSLTGTATIANGLSSVAITVTTIDDSSVEGDETVVLTISSNSGYSIGSPSSATVTITDNEALPPTGRWQLDNNLNDSVGTHNGTFNGGTAAYATGKIGQALNLDGVDDNVDILYPTDPNAYTMTAWIKANDVTSVDIMDRGSSNISEGSNLVMIDGNSKFAFSIYATDATHVLTGTTTAVAGSWYFLAVTATNNGQMHLYVNGVEEGTPQALGTMWDAGDRYRVGLGYPGIGIGYFSGLVDDVRIYEQALNATSIQAIYNESTVSISATDATAGEQGADTGTFTLTRNNTSGNLVVNYTISGTATNGTDYSSIVSSVTIASGQTTATVTIAPIDDNSVEGAETAILTINSSANYSISGTGNATVTITDNPTGRWTFNNTLVDSEGSNNGTFTGGTAAYGTGKIGQALNLDGVDDNVDLPYVTDPNAYTMSAWVKPVDVTSVVIMSRGSSNVNEGSNLVMIDGNSKFAFSIYATNGNFLITGTTTVQANTWYHVTVTATNNGQMHLFVNGVEEGTAQNIATMWDAGDRYHVGLGFPFISLGYYSGLVDDVRFYAQALTTPDISTIYQMHSYADDGFESGTTSGGSGWGGNWSLTGHASITGTGGPATGSFHLQLTSGDGVASRAANMAGVTTAYLSFDWKANLFEAGETAVVEVYNGSSWVNVMTISDGQDDNVYHHADIKLSSAVLSSSFQVRFRSLMSDVNDFFYVDNLVISM